MGCDIHMYVEQKGTDNKWHIVQGIDQWEAIAIEDSINKLTKFKEEIYDVRYAVGNCYSWAFKGEPDPKQHNLIKALNEAINNDSVDFCLDLLNKRKEENDKKKHNTWIYFGRNYELFGILADVRNYSEFKTIASPRGLPENISREVEKEADDWGCDGHSHSYLYLRELTAFDWSQTDFERGIVDEEQYVKHVRNKLERPESWCMGVGGPGIKIISSTEMNDILDGKKEREEGTRYFVDTQWRITYKDVCKDFVERVIPTLQELSKRKKKAVRIIFWFDN